MGEQVVRFVDLSLMLGDANGFMIASMAPHRDSKHGLRAKSLFRLGLDYLCHLVLHPPLQRSLTCLALPKNLCGSRVPGSDFKR